MKDRALIALAVLVIFLAVVVIPAVIEQGWPK